MEKMSTFTGDSKWITSEDTRKWVHELRAKYDAIMIAVVPLSMTIHS